MIGVNDIKPGLTIEMDGNLFVVIEFQHSKSARSQAVVRTKLKNLRTGSTTEHTFSGNDKVEKAHIEKRKMQYLYDDGTSLVFMDNNSYEQVEINKSRLEWEINFLKGNDEVEITSYNSEVLGVFLPSSVALQVTEAEPAVKGDTATSASKNAVLETGLSIRVPLFIEEGEVVLVNTTDGKYLGRSKD